MRPIFAGNLEYDTRQADLERLFSKYGRIERVDMKSGKILCFSLLMLSQRTSIGIYLFNSWWFLLLKILVSFSWLRFKILAQLFDAFQALGFLINLVDFPC